MEVSEEALERTPALLEAAGMPKRIHVTADKDTLAAAGDLPRLLEKAGYHLSWTVYDSMNSATVEAARALEAELGDAQGVLAVGTGSVSDVSRVACFARNLPYAIFGTAPSMDGFASNSAPMIENGYKRTHYGYQPLGRHCRHADSGAVSADSESRWPGGCAGQVHCSCGLAGGPFAHRRILLSQRLPAGGAVCSGGL